MGASDVALRLIIGGDSKGAVDALNRVKKAAGDAELTTSERFSAMGQGMSAAGSKMTMGFTVPLMAIGAGSVMVAADFETSMNQVQQALDASSADMRSLTDHAEQMGAKTMFSA